MSVFDFIAVLIALTALFSYLNSRTLKLPTTIGVLVFAMGLSLFLIVLSHLGVDLESGAERMVAQIDFDETLLKGLLSFLLFAGALHINLEDLARRKWIIGLLATFGVCTSTIIVSVLMFAVFRAFGLEISFLYCLIFGALISPTDPIAVLALLKKAKVPKSLETKIAGESLFNDGIGVVLFLVLVEGLSSGGGFDLGHVAILLAQEAVGGVLLGIGLGWVTYQMLKSVDNYQVEILLTLALVTGGYSLAMKLHTSGPLAIVAAGLLIGNHGRSFAMSERTREHLDSFWELVDEILNAVLFVLIGLEVLVLSLTGRFLSAGLLAIPIVLLARFVSVGGLINLLRLKLSFSPHVVKIMTWGGLRGGISVALVLSLPPGPERSLILTVTYLVVAFSIIVQGLTLPSLLRRVR